MVFSAFQKLEKIKSIFANAWTEIMIIATSLRNKPPLPKWNRKTHEFAHRGFFVVVRMNYLQPFFLLALYHMLLAFSSIPYFILFI